MPSKLLIASLVLPLAAASAAAQDGERAIAPGSLRMLSDPPGACQDPVIDAVGDDAIVAWKSLYEGRSRIFAVRRINRDWTFPYPVDSSLDGDCLDPVVRFAPGGDPGIAWVRREGETSFLEFAPPAGFPATIAKSALRMESPSLDFDAAGTPVLAWTESEAGRYLVMTARRDAEGKWVRERASTSPDAYDVFPQVFGTPVPSVCWYTLGEQDFSLTGVELAPGGWVPFAPPTSELVPANRFPLLYGTGTTPGALWVEPLSDGEIVVAWDPRFPASEPLLPMPGATGARQLEPDASGGPGAPSFAWREEDSTGSDILVLHRETLARLEGFPHPSQPRIAPNDSGGLHLIVVSDRTDGGTGQVYWTTLE
ncbi:MAG: hypothetical protein PWP23_2383 [Candidatus Sumerlaeota bacterium]|nr:hypothetical protein [Candidatus Sumerlaeota bacterium]